VWHLRVFLHRCLVVHCLSKGPAYYQAGLLFFRVMAQFMHEYLSAACYHKRHDECDEMCEYCQAPCLCPCHQQTANEDGEWDHQ